MVNLDVIKNYFLKIVLEESDNFKALPEKEKQASVDRIAKLSEDKQKDLCVFFVSQEKTTLPGKIFMRFVKEVSNSVEALTHVAEKDKAILNRARNGRKESEIQTNL
jgi:hypothetical protein